MSILYNIESNKHYEKYSKADKGAQKCGSGFFIG